MKAALGDALEGSNSIEGMNTGKQLGFRIATRGKGVQSLQEYAPVNPHDRVTGRLECVCGSEIFRYRSSKRARLHSLSA